jgi:hypothetical protein
MTRDASAGKTSFNTLEAGCYVAGLAFVICQYTTRAQQIQSPREVTRNCALRNCVRTLLVDRNESAAQTAAPVAVAEVARLSGIEKTSEALTRNLGGFAFTLPNGLR